MITVIKYSPEYREEWDRLISTSRTPMFMFMRGFMEYHADRFTDHSLMFYDSGELIGALPASEKGGVLCSHAGLTYGGMISTPRMKQHTMLECFEALLAHAAASGAEELIYKSIPYIYSNYPSQEDLYALFRKDAHLMKAESASVVDLTAPVRLAKGRKAQIARAKREGVMIEQSHDYSAFIELENEVLTKHHHTTAVHTAQELQLLATLFPENIKLYIARHNGQMIAATLLFIYHHVIHTQYMAADETARQIGGLDLLVKTLMDHYAESKRWFDFGISTEQAGRELNEGLIAQKEGFGARSIIQHTWKMHIPKPPITAH